jgi:hypothetical protein
VNTKIILRNPTETELALSVQENLFDLFRDMAARLGGELEEGDGLSRHLSFPTNPMFKGVWQTHLSPEQTDSAIEETIAWFKSRNAPYFFWWTGPSTMPDDLGKRLQKYGMLDMAESGMKPRYPTSNRSLSKRTKSPRSWGNPGWMPPCISALERRPGKCTLVISMASQWLRICFITAAA